MGARVAMPWTSKIALCVLSVALMLGRQALYSSDELEQLRPHPVHGNIETLNNTCHVKNHTTVPSCVVRAELSDLVSRGFAAVPSFLTEKELNHIRELYYSKGWKDNVNFPTKMVDESEWPPGLYNKMIQLVRQISEATDLRVDMPLPRSLFFIANSSDSQHSFGVPWHQDTESFLLAENHYNYVNIYMPVEKGAPEDGNLQMVPFDTLKKCSPALHDLTHGKGAVDFVDCRGNTAKECQQHFELPRMSDEGIGLLPDRPAMLRLDNNHAAVHALGFHLDSIACVPELRSGDLLAFRGDIIHKTGTFRSPRLAWSVRVVSAQDTISIDRLLHGGGPKLDTINGNLWSFTDRMGVIRATGRQEMSYAELRSTRGCGRRDESCSLSRFEHFMSRLWSMWYAALFRWRWLQYHYRHSWKT